jgi:cytochrome c oxidase subunit IV
MTAHAHDSHDDHHGLGHILPVKLLAGVLGALLVLTGLTVLTGSTYLYGFDLGIAMVIATVKATLVCVIFMHLKWDKGFHAFAFLGSVLFVGVFLAYTLTDSKEYQETVRSYSADVSLNSPFAVPLPDPRPSTHDHDEEDHAEDDHSEPANGEGTEH